MVTLHKNICFFFVQKSTIGVVGCTLPLCTDATTILEVAIFVLALIGYGLE